MSRLRVNDAPTGHHRTIAPGRERKQANTVGTRQLAGAVDVPVTAPYFSGARLVIAADCAPFAFADFHRRFLAGGTLIVGCPKLDDAEQYQRKLTEIFRGNDVGSVEIVYMEVPCCFGLVRLVKQALKDSGKDIPLTLTKVGIRGEILETQGKG